MKQGSTSTSRGQPRDQPLVPRLALGRVASRPRRRPSAARATPSASGPRAPAPRARARRAGTTRACPAPVERRGARVMVSPAVADVDHRGVDPVAHTAAPGVEFRAGLGRRGRRPPGLRSQLGQLRQSVLEAPRAARSPARGRASVMSAKQWRMSPTRYLPVISGSMCSLPSTSAIRSAISQNRVSAAAADVEHLAGAPRGPPAPAGRPGRRRTR